MMIDRLEDKENDTGAIVERTDEYFNIRTPSARFRIPLDADIFMRDQRINYCVNRPMTERHEAPPLAGNANDELTNFQIMQMINQLDSEPVKKQRPKRADKMIDTDSAKKTSSPPKAYVMATFACIVIMVAFVAGTYIYMHAPGASSASSSTHHQTKAHVTSGNKDLPGSFKIEKSSGNHG